MAGFFLLDDPFTDMDATRRAAAIQAISLFEQWLRQKNSQPLMPLPSIGRIRRRIQREFSFHTIPS